MMLRRLIFAGATLVASHGFFFHGLAPVEAQTSVASRIEGAAKESTLGVGWVNLTTVDMAAWGELLQSVGLPMEGEATQQVQFLRKQLLDTGASHVLLIGEFDSMAQGKPVLLIPSKNTAATKALVETMVPPGAGMTVLASGDQVLIGPSDRLVKILENGNKPASKLIDTVKKLNGDHGAVVSIPKPTREILGVFLLNYPKPEEGKKLYSLLTGFDTLQVSFEEAKKKLHLEVEFASPNVAQQAHSFFGEVAGFDPALPEKLKPSLNQSTITWEIEGLAPLKQMLTAMGAIRQARESALAMQKMNNLKQIGLAFHNFESAYQTLLPQALASKDGKRLLSWRVMILPFIEQANLYNQFHLDEAWDSPHNLEVAKTIPSIYESKGVEPGKTTIQVLLAPASVMGRAGKPVQFRDITDGTSNTVWVTEVDAADAVLWTKPEDFDATTEAAFKRLFSTRDAVPFGFVDGSIRTLPKTLPFDTFKKLLTINGGEVVELP